MAQDGGAEFHAAWPYQAPPTGHFNTFVTNAILAPPTTVYGDLIYQPLGMYYWATNEWLPLLATEWSFIQTGTGTASPMASPGASPTAVASPAATAVAGDATPSAVVGGINLNADTFEVKLREGAVWSDDSPFTSQDVVDTLWVLRIMSNTVWQYIDDAVAVDDHTVHCHLSLPSTVVERYVIRASVPRPSSIFGEWAQRARDLFASGKTLDDPEGLQLLEQFSEFRPETVPASGPYMIDPASITNAQMTLAKNDMAWNADQAKFDRIVNYNGEDPGSIASLILLGDVDYATHGFAPASEREMIENGIRIVRPPIYSGPAVYMNFARHGDTLGDKRVRQAIAHAVDRNQNGTVALAESGIAVRYMTGMSDNVVPEWLTDDAVSRFNPYEYDPEKAAALLQEAGWTKDGDVWTMSNGEEARFDLIFPAEFADWSATGLDLAEQLSSFGIVVEPVAIAATQQPIDVDRGNFDLAIRGWGSSSNPHPHFAYAQAFFTHNTLARNNGGEGIAFPLTQETDVAGTVDLEQLTVDSAEGLDEEKQKANITTIAQVFNELLPIVPLWERYGNNPVVEGVRVKAWPPEGDPIYQNSPYADGIPTMLIYTGKLEPGGGD
jgi:peptide/nickel transport system substrate-binding protein